jgi:hypothetical protein
MYADVSKWFDVKNIVVRAGLEKDRWVLDLDTNVFIMMDDKELDSLKYAVDSAVFERDMGFEFAAHASDGTVDDLVHGADSGGKQ